MKPLTIEDVREWTEIGERIRAVNPARWRELLGYLREMADAQEVLHEGRAWTVASRRQVHA